MKAPVASLVVHAMPRVKPERVDDSLHEAATLVDARSRQATFAACDLHRDANDSTAFTLQRGSVTAWA